MRLLITEIDSKQNLHLGYYSNSKNNNKKKL